MAYSPEKETLMAPLVKRFNAEGHRSDGRLVYVAPQVIASGDAETRIAQGKLRPVLWSPASSFWGRLLNYESDRRPVADDNPSITRLRDATLAGIDAVSSHLDRDASSDDPQAAQPRPRGQRVHQAGHCARARRRPGRGAPAGRALAGAERAQRIRSFLAEKPDADPASLERLHERLADTLAEIDQIVTTLQTMRAESLAL